MYSCKFAAFSLQFFHVFAWNDPFYDIYHELETNYIFQNPVMWGRQAKLSTEVQLYDGEVLACLVEERRSDLKEDASDLSPLEVAAKDTRE
jgi:hypothetical protein